MDINNQAAITRLRERWQTRTLKAFTEGPAPVSEQICQIEQSTAAIEVYDMLVKFPAFERFKDQVKKGNMAREQVRIPNDEFSDVVAVKQADIERDQIGQYNNIFDMLGVAARRHPDKLLAALMVSGFTTNDYTGQPFFDADKPHLPGVVDARTFTNKMTEKPSAGSWEKAKQLMGNIVDANGDPMGIGIKKLVVCSQKWESTFKRILHAELIGQVVGTGAAAVSNIYAGDADMVMFPYLNTAANEDKPKPALTAAQRSYGAGFKAGLFGTAARVGPVRVRGRSTVIRQINKLLDQAYEGREPVVPRKVSTAIRKLHSSKVRMDTVRRMLAVYECRAKFPNVSLYRIAIKTELDIDFQLRSKSPKPMTDEQKRIRYGIEVSRLLRQARQLIENAEAGIFPCVKPLEKEEPEDDLD